MTHNMGEDYLHLFFFSRETWTLSIVCIVELRMMMILIFVDHILQSCYDANLSNVR